MKVKRHNAHTMKVLIIDKPCLTLQIVSIILPFTHNAVTYITNLVCFIFF